MASPISLGAKKRSSCPCQLGSQNWFRPSMGTNGKNSCYSDHLRYQFQCIGFRMEIIFHYPPELTQLLIQTIPLLCPSKPDVLLFFKGAGVPESVFSDIAFTVDTISYQRMTRIGQMNPDLMRPAGMGPKAQQAHRWLRSHSRP